MNNSSPYCTVDEARELIACCMAKNIPFYACRYPGEALCRFGAQSHSCPSGVEKAGFRVVPFDVIGDAPAFTIVPDLFPADIEIMRSLPNAEVMCQSFTRSDIDRDVYMQQVDNLVLRMNRGELSKVVLSRTITYPYDVVRFLPDCFVRMCNAYKDAYIFVVNNPGVCGWMGASPEVLLQSTSDGYVTMALAGTRMAHTQAEWGAKEREEQQYVSRYITEVLALQGMTQVAVNSYTKQAAQVEHLCTHFDITTHHNAEVRDRLTTSLHPTPAVAGTPTQAAIEAIKATESHSRRYYAGYVGEVSSNGECGLYVNLRSMEFVTDAVRLYVGGGLTAQSVAKDEWEETCAKSQTLLTILQ